MAGSITFPGIGSGIDGAGIAKAVSDQIRLQNEVHRRSIEQLTAESTSLESLRGLLTDVSDRLDAMRTVSGGAAFKQASSSNQDIISAAADSSAKTASYTISISSLASAAVGSFNRSFAAAHENIANAGQSGTVQFTVGTGDQARSFAVAVDETTTAAQFVSDFNQAADGAAAASLINIGTAESPQYRIAFNTTAAGTAEGSIALQSDNAGLLNGALGGSTVEQAANAKFTISGVAGVFERSSNMVNDAISGVSLELQAIGSATVTVASDAQSAADQVEAFVAAYNAAVQFAAREDRVQVLEEDDGRTNVFGSLASTNVDDSAFAALREAVSSAKSEDGGLGLASLGVSTNRDGTLAFDRKAFEAAHAADSSRASQAVTSLADKVAGVDGAVHQFAGYAQQIDGALSANESEIARLQETIDRVERSASDREEAILKQFSSLEGLLAKLNADSQFVGSLLQF